MCRAHGFGKIFGLSLQAVSYNADGERIETTLHIRYGAKRRGRDGWGALHRDGMKIKQHARILTGIAQLNDLLRRVIFGNKLITFLSKIAGYMRHLGLLLTL